MQLDQLQVMAGITVSAAVTENLAPYTRTRCKADDIAYLRNKMPDASAETLDMLRFYLILADTKSITGVDVFEEKPEDFDAFMAQYKLWELLKS
jgi:hypothetical protein